MDRNTFFNLIKEKEKETSKNMMTSAKYYMDVYDGNRKFNSAAAIFGSYWFLHRKMYLFGFISLATFFSYTTLIVTSAIKEKELVFLGVTLALSILRGYFGNVIYFVTAQHTSEA